MLKLIVQSNKIRPFRPGQVIRYRDRAWITIVLVKQVENRPLHFHSLKEFFSNNGKIEQRISRRSSLASPSSLDLLPLIKVLRLVFIYFQ